MEGFISGWIGGIVGTFVGHPMDTIKGRLQTQGVSGRAVNYRSPYHCFIDICRTEGVRALYKGLAGPVLSYGIINGVVFGAYSHSMAFIQPNGGRPTMKSIIVSSSVVALAQFPICLPIELMKLRLQTQGVKEVYRTKLFGRNTNGLSQMAISIYHTQGIKGFYKGFRVTLVRDTLGFIGYFVAYEKLCQYCAGDKMLHEVSAPQLMVSGGVAGMVSWAICYPLDMVKSRFQTDGVLAAPEYKGAIDCFIKSYRAEGLSVFFRGLGVTMLRAFPVNAATFYTVTTILRFWKNDQSREYSVL